MKYLLRMQACGINVNKPLGSGLFAKAMASFSFGSLICNIWSDGPISTVGVLSVGSPGPSTAAPSEEERGSTEVGTGEVWWCHGLRSFFLNKPLLLTYPIKGWFFLKIGYKYEFEYYIRIHANIKYILPNCHSYMPSLFVACLKLLILEFLVGCIFCNM